MHKDDFKPPSRGAVLNYDPNIAALKFSRQRVRLTFGKWDFRVTMIVVVTCHRSCGLSVIEQSIAAAYNNLPCYTYEGEQKRCLLMDREDDIPLECRDENDQGEEWLRSMLISAEIIELV